MAPTLTFACLLPLLLLLFPILSSSQSTFISSKATFYGSPDGKGTPNGACGYGELGRNLYGGDTAAVSRLYLYGAGCGACYQVRCTHPQLCNGAGVKIVVTDHGGSDDADFILSAQAFAKLARPNLAAQLMAYGEVNIEYRRISCQYSGYNMMFLIKEQSKYPNYLAFIIVYQAGKKDILAVELWQEDCKEWRAMRRAYGGVWDMVNPPQGPITCRLLTADAYGKAWIQLTDVVPADWKAGVAYDTAIQLA